MDYVAEAKKFIQRARDAFSPDVKDQHLAMADWCLSQVTGESDGESKQEPKKTD